MFETLSQRLQETMRRLRGRGKLTEADVAAAMREVRMALLEADVSLPVVKDFTARVRARAVGIEVLQSLSPAQHVIKIVKEELTALLGTEPSRLRLAPDGSSLIMLVGLQGAGKTTAAAKLALHLKKQGRRPLLVAADTRRPAAIKQLHVLGEKAGVPVFSQGDRVAAVALALAAVSHARTEAREPVVLDTAGRLQVDDELMRELEDIKAAVNPVEILLVADAMTGQEAVNVASEFHRRLGITGVILTKLDSDTRGGAALSVRAATGAPVKFAGTGEKLDMLEVFHPDRLASRILGMGDVLTLIEKAEEAYDVEQARKLEQKLRNLEFTLEDFLDQMKQLKKLGPLDQLMGMIPGMERMRGKVDLGDSERDLKRAEAIINSMTRDERRHPNIIDGSRRRRIALGSGTRVQDINRLLKQFDQAKKMLRQVGNLEREIRRGGRLPQR
ncbi:MAG: signal recognition particle protein [Bacillota bacterium]